MKFIKLESKMKRDELIELIKNHELVNDKVRFDGKAGKPTMFVKETKRGIRVKCQYTDGAIKDSGFLEGTYFIGNVKESDNGSIIKGIVVTAPIYHSILAIIMALLVYQCIYLGGFNPVPVIWLAFSVLMFKGEFEKQGVIERYIKRAVQKSADIIANRTI